MKLHLTLGKSSYSVLLSVRLSTEIRGKVEDHTVKVKKPLPPIAVGNPAEMKIFDSGDDAGSAQSSKTFDAIRN
jgi:hypothetical protein